MPPPNGLAGALCGVLVTLLLGLACCCPRTRRLPALPPFPVYTRSGEVIVDVSRVDDDVRLGGEERELVIGFHKYTFSQVHNSIAE